MQFLFLIGFDSDYTPVPNTPAGPDNPTIEEWGAEVEASGAWLAGDRLRPAADATTVMVRGGELLVTDGPFTEGKEYIAGFDVIEADDLDAAIAIARRHPQAWGGVIEIRPVWPLGL